MFRGQSAGGGGIKTGNTTSGLVLIESLVRKKKVI